jgi:hypothetical protein
MKASSAHRLLPFETFGEAATFDLEVEVSCRCGRRVVIDGMAHHGHAVPLYHDPAPWMGVRWLAFDLYLQARPWPVDHGRAFARHPGPPGGIADRCQSRDFRLNREALRGRVSDRMSSNGTACCSMAGCRLALSPRLSHRSG